jgi:hypothetical protein
VGGETVECRQAGSCLWNAAKQMPQDEIVSPQGRVVIDRVPLERPFIGFCLKSWRESKHQRQSIYTTSKATPSMADRSLTPEVKKSFEASLCASKQNNH